MRINDDQGMDHCKNKYNGVLAVPNSREETVFLATYLDGFSVSFSLLCFNYLRERFQKSIISSTSVVDAYIGSELSMNTKYLEFQDGSLMTDGLFLDAINTSFTTLYGGGRPTGCFKLGSLIGGVLNCQGGATVLCEITLYKDTHVCLNKDFLSAVNLNTSTELAIPSNVIFIYKGRSERSEQNPILFSACR